MAVRRCAITSAERTWCSRKKVSKRERRASWAACRVGQRRRKSQKNARVFVLKPLERLWEIVFQGAREPMGDPHFISHHAPAVFNELAQGTHGGALRMEGLSLVTVRTKSFELQCGVGGSSCARLGVNASRYHARVRGLCSIGQERQSS